MVTQEPAHPGELIRSFCLNPRGLTVTEAATALGITRDALLELLNGRAGISRRIALRLESAFNTRAERWIAIQQQYDLWRVREAAKLAPLQQLCEQTVGK
ncbi:MAG: HigA family addiction module antidote protein [Deltaproteobacteria bacterium]|nr:HigA family addiction module antidote protein [Deltaproteobacteria bacterium]